MQDFEENVCAIILDYFGAEKTRRCVLSLRRQGLRTVYVLDNSGAQDASVRLWKSLDGISSEDLGFKIDILTAGKNLGFGRGVNFVLRHDRQSKSPHDYYLLLNNDAVAGPRLVSALIGELRNDPSVSLVAPRVVSNDPGREYGIWYHRYLGLLLSKPGTFRFHYYTGCCLSFSKELVIDNGIFDEDFFMYGEDAELGWRLMRAGKKTRCAEDAYVEHEYGPSVDRSSFFYEYHMARSHLLVSWKTWTHPVEIPLLLLTKLIGLGARAAARCCRYRTLTPFFSLLAAWLPLRMDKS